MPLNVADRVRETTTTTGTGTITLAGAVIGYQSFAAVGNGNTTYYTINAGSQWEVGIGTYTGAGPSLSRDTVLESSNAGSLVNFSAGTKDVFVTYPAEKSISDGYGLLPIANGGTGATTAGGALTSLGAYPASNPSGYTSNTGTVTSVNLTASTGISVSGGPITTSGSITVTNTAPDQVVSLTGAGTTSISGTYPNFTITSNDSTLGTVTSVSGTGTVNGLTLTGTVTSSGSLTLGGTLTGVNLTSQVTGTLPVANGGTGATSLTSGYLVKGNGTSAASASVVYDNGTNVGIGTSSPTDLLTVSGGSVASTIAGSGAGLQMGRIAMYSSALGAAYTNYGGEIRSYSGAGIDVSDLRFYTANAAATAERMRIDSSGNVGIGTSSPSTFGKFAIGPTGSSGTENQIATVAGSAGAFVSAVRLGLYAPTGALGCSISASMNYSGATTTSLIFSTSPAGAGTSDLPTERMRIDGSGNVGIGTTSPQARLEISGASGTSVSSRITNTTASGFTSLEFDDGTVARGQIWAGNASYASFGGAGSINYSANSGPHVWYTNYAERMRIGASGNVLMGTTSIGVSGNANTILSLANGNTDVYTSLKSSSGPELISGATPVECFSGTFTSSPYVIRTNNAERMRITAAGLVGIGLTPAHLFSVKAATDGVNTFIAGATKAVRVNHTTTETRLEGVSQDGTTFQPLQIGGSFVTVSESGTEVARFTGGNLALGTTNTTAISGYTSLKINNGTNGAILDLAQGDTYRGRLVGTTSALAIETNTGLPIVFSPAGVERMRISAAGGVSIGTTTDPGAGNLILSGKIIPEVQSTTSTATLTPNANNDDVVSLSAQAVALTVAAPSGTSSDGQKLIIRIKDNGSTQTINWNGVYAAGGASLPTATVAGKWHHVGLIYNVNTTTWLCVAATVQA